MTILRGHHRPEARRFGRSRVWVENRFRYWALSEANVMRTLPPSGGNINGKMGGETSDLRCTARLRFWYEPLFGLYE